MSLTGSDSPLYPQYVTVMVCSLAVAALGMLFARHGRHLADTRRKHLRPDLSGEGVPAVNVRLAEIAPLHPAAPATESAMPAGLRERVDSVSTLRGKWIVA